MMANTKALQQIAAHTTNQLRKTYFRKKNIEELKKKKKVRTDRKVKLNSPEILGREGDIRHPQPPFGVPIKAGVISIKYS